MKNILKICVLVFVCLFVLNSCSVSKPSDLKLPSNGVDEMLIKTKNDSAKYSNPFTLPEEWPEYGIGDPYIMKYNGIFYLYASTPYMTTGVRCWTSKNLVDWKFEGNITDEAAAFTAYSPKVIFWNGKFYLYITPNGQGLHILVSESPTGKFKDVTGKIHDSIDACIFIDDNGQWYMTHGKEKKGVEMHSMSSPLTVDEKPQYLNAVIDGDTGISWTETGQIIKRDDKYFITFSGNHVASSSYRTLWGVTDSLSKPIAKGQSPLVCATNGKLVGTACGIVFQGPDLLNDYIVYHNLVNPYKGPIRQMDIDLISYNNNELIAYGPTSDEQIAPKMPDFAEYFEGSSNGIEILGNAKAEKGFATLEANSKVLTKNKTEKNFASEFNIYPSENAKAVFSYTDDNNYSFVTISKDGLVELKKVSGNEMKTVSSSKMQADFNPSTLHNIKVVKNETNIQVFVDGMKKISDTKENFGEGKIGYIATQQSKVGFFCFSNGTANQNIRKAYKPITGNIQAVDYILEDKTFSTVKSESGALGLSLKKDEWARYNINALSGGEYTVNITYKAQKDAQLIITDKSGKILGYEKATATGGKWQVCTIRGVTLQSGADVIAVSVKNGDCELLQYQFKKSTEVKEISVLSELNDENGWKHLDGKWQSGDNGITFDDSLGFGKLVTGDIGWTDYSVEGDITLDSSSFGTAGFLVRVENASSGADFTQKHPYNDQSYYVYIDANGKAGLNKHNFSDINLATGKFSYQKDKANKMKVTLKANKITVEIDNKIVIEYADNSYPFTTGKVGLHCEDAIATFSDILIKPTKK